ncbi:RiPP maturation radical SAM protein 1 [candidate division KSB1 bacterium]|nr:RiPP maturation radical SAM protein 1 [candidate division KSB1 bacterium]NIV70714.1 RiPP maturation radical SAM protein 1 [Phycisphaerae bacterium]NIR72679.1 RiPP maturation radical SAM protein 1 [candidate division KSB1 bacterium]NIS23701.1 RiPP maturation radical SAM protein 1 [candidate division KSB1 bacterium]NIT70621.1 RiPP maturation radical SAM protein 1 [candidate division KSB1 bacterium]
MYKIALINMPFAGMNMPSFALTQLKSVLDSRFKDHVSVDIYYLNQDFARTLGIDFYKFMTDSMEAYNAGLGEWLFRQVAFPQLEENSEEYLQRYFPYRDERSEMLKRTILDKWQGIDYLLGALIDKYKLDHADIVGFTSMFSQNVACFAMARKLKERNAEIITVMGGANCETPMGEAIAMNVEAIDFVFSGPGLKSFPGFVEHCLNGESEKCRKIKGVFSRNNLLLNGNGMKGSIGDELPIDVKVEVNYEKFLDTYEKNFPDQEKPILFFETSRGCWWGEKAHCTFCGLNGMTMQYRAMSPKNAIELFESLFKYYPRSSYYFCVDNILPTNYIDEVLPRLDPPSDATIFYEVKADFSEEDLKVLSKAKLNCIQPGIESLATSTLKLMKKGTSSFQNLTLMKNSLIHDVELVWNILIGFPGETEEVYEKYVRDIPFLIHLPPPTGVYPVRFDRYSPYFMKADEYGLDLHPYDYYELIYPFSKEVLENLAYYFMDHNSTADYFVATAKWVHKIREQVEMWRSHWTRGYGSVPPRLFFKDNGKSDIVYDSRSGAVVEHQVGKDGKQVLEQLARPKRIDKVAEDLDFDPQQQLTFLVEKGLVFQDGERYMSLVFEKEPPPLSPDFMTRSR